MPVVRGFDATRAIKRSMPRVPILLFSGYSNLLKPEEARTVGISALVSKFEPSMLVDAAHQQIKVNVGGEKTLEAKAPGKAA